MSTDSHLSQSKRHQGKMEETTFYVKFTLALCLSLSHAGVVGQRQTPPLPQCPLPTETGLSGQPLPLRHLGRDAGNSGSGLLSGLKTTCGPAVVGNQCKLVANGAWTVIA